MKFGFFLFTTLFSFSAFAIQTPPTNCALLVSGKSLHDVWNQIFAEKDIDGDVDRYLEESGAQADFRAFQTRTGQRERGEQRLVIAVSPQTWPIYLKYFGGRNIFEQIASPNNQAHNVFRWQNETFLGADAAAFPGYGSLGLPILLSDSEATRLHQALYICTRYNGYQYPFNVPGYGFPATSYYQNCAAWAGYLMIGDTNVSQVHAPGNLEHNLAAPPLVSTLTQFPMPAHIAPQDQPILREAFSVPGHQTLWEMLGFPLHEGDFTSSGWFTHSVLGRAPHKRLPVVAYYTNDHTQPIPDPLNPGIYLLGHPNPTSGPDGIHY